MCIYIYVYILIYTYTYINMYVYIHMYTHMQRHLVIQLAFEFAKENNYASDFSILILRSEMLIGQKSSNPSLLLTVLYKTTVELTFENFWYFGHWSCKNSRMSACHYIYYIEQLSSWLSRISLGSVWIRLVKLSKPWISISEKFYFFCKKKNKITCHQIDGEKKITR